MLSGCVRSTSFVDAFSLDELTNGSRRKSNRLEFYSQTADGLVLQHAKAIYGKVSVLQRIARPRHETDLLFVGTDRYAYFTLSWDPTRKHLRTEQKYVDMSDASLRDSQNGDRAWVDPSGKFLTLEIYEGIITVIPIAPEPLKRTQASAANASASAEEQGILGEPHQARIEELSVRSTAFLDQDPTRPPRLAILYENTQGRVRLKLRDLVYTRGIVGGEASVAEFKYVDDLYDDLELGADLLIPVPLPLGKIFRVVLMKQFLWRYDNWMLTGGLGGLIILGEKFIKYVDANKNETITRPLETNTIFVTWEQIDNQRWLLADDYGRLYFLMLVLNSAHTVQTWKIDPLGETSRASVLVHLGGGVIFLGSHQGDSHVIKITEGSFEVVQTLSNIAPILDFTVMDLGSRGETVTHEFSSGQARIVTGSGAFCDGSLRSVRSGVGMEDFGVLGSMEHITDLWGLSAFCPDGVSDTLLLSFVDESRVFFFTPDGEVEEKDDFLGLVLSEPTIHAATLGTNRMLQVTEHAARVTDVESGMAMWEWFTTCNQKITAASVNKQHLVLVVGGQELVVFSVVGEIKMAGTKTFATNKQISGVALTPLPFPACVLSFPQSAEIVIMSLEDLSVKHTEPLGEPGDDVPRSVLIANMIPYKPPTLFVAMADGGVFSYSFNANDYSLLDMNKLVLGSEAPVFKLLPRGNGLYNIFATCDHPSMIYATEDRIVYSAVNSDKATRICHFNAQAYPGAIAVATPDELKIALVDAERTTQIQTLTLKETVRRIAYSPTERAFAIGTIQRTLIDNVEEVKSHVMLADEIVFRQLSVFDLNPDELVECVIRAEHPNSNGDSNNGHSRDIFVVGTSVLDTPDVADARTKGRILVFDVDANRELRKLSDFPVRGACRALGIINNKIVAALMKTVGFLSIILKILELTYW